MVELAGPTAVLLAVLAVVLVIVLGLALAAQRGTAPRRRQSDSAGALAVTGGHGPVRPSAHRRVVRRREGLVVDTLNLVYWLRGERARRGAPDAAEIAAAVTYSAPRLRAAIARRPGASSSPSLIRIVFVVKDVSPPLGTVGWTRIASAARAVRADLEVVFAVRRADARPRRGESAEVRHARRGVDDAYAAFRAAELGCAVASNDAFADFRTVFAVAPPMTILAFDPFAAPGAPPTRRAFNAAELPAARLRRTRPVAIRFDELLETGC